MDINQIIETINHAEYTVNTPLEDFPPNVRAGHAVAKAESAAVLAQAKSDYWQWFRSNGIVMFLLGSDEDTQAFAKIAAQEARTFTVDAMELYRTWAEKIFPSIGNSGEFGVTQMRLLMNEVDDLRVDLEIKRQGRTVSQDNIPFIPNIEACADHIRNCVRVAFGDELNQKYIEKKLLQTALAERYVGSVAPLAVLNAAEPEQAILTETFTKGSATINVAVPVDSDSVIAQLKEVRRSKLLGKQPVTEQATATETPAPEVVPEPQMPSEPVSEPEKMPEPAAEPEKAPEPAKEAAPAGFKKKKNK